MSAIPKKWACHCDDEVCVLDIEDDRMTIGEPMVVTLWAQHHDGTDDHTTLCCATPEQAREMAAALLHYANAAERRNAQDAAASRETDAGAGRDGGSVSGQFPRKDDDHA